MHGPPMADRHLADPIEALAAECGRVLRDRLAPGRVAVPRQLTGVTARWLSATCGAAVHSVVVASTESGTTTRAILRTEADGLPASVFVKLAPTALRTRMFVDLVRLGHNEVLFYRHLGDLVPLAVPRCFGALVDPATGRFALVLEDLGARGCVFGDLRSGVGAHRAGRVVRALARMHGAFWADPRFSAKMSWVVAERDAPARSLTRGLVIRALRRAGARFPHIVPAPMQRELEWLAHRYDPVQTLLWAGPPTLTHGDPHPGNVAFDGDDPVFFDWQVVRKGPAWRDVAYFLTLSVDPEVRSVHERELIGLYAESLAAAGGPPFSADEAWSHYRAHAVDALVAAAFTAVFGGMQAAPIAETGLERALKAAAELYTFALLRHQLGG